MQQREMIKNFTNAVIANNSLEAETSFNTIMMAKVSEKLDILHAQVAKTMFNPTETENDNFRPQ